MKTDNSRSLEEKYLEGYSKRCSEITNAILIVIENELYELTPRQANKFKSIRFHGNGVVCWHKSLDYIRKNCKPLNINTKCFNY